MNLLKYVIKKTIEIALLSTKGDPILVSFPTHLLLKVGRYYEGPESAQFNFGAVFLAENALQPLGWAHRWNVTHKNNQNQLAKQVFILY